jgi:DNA polymerase-3 subunit alpha
LSWIPLHVHTEYSALDGAIKIERYIDWAVKNNVSSIAITDHGRLSGIPIFYDKIKKLARDKNIKIKPIYGMEAYTESVTGTGEKYHHMVMLARNEAGLKNLFTISNLSFENMYDGKGIVKPEVLKEYKEGIIFLSACMQGELSFLLRNGEADKVKQFMDFMRDTEFFIELIDIGDPEQEELNGKLLDVSEKYKIPAVVTPDAHYFQEDKWWYPTLWASSWGSTLDQIEEKYGLSKQDLSLPSPKDIEERYPAHIIKNTEMVADMVEDDIKIGFDKYMMPKLSHKADLRQIAESGLREKIKKFNLPEEEYSERLNHELEVITSLGFTDYMLLVKDVVQTARDKNIYVGPGRGSAAGSLVAWAIDITAVDPIRHGLLFERFINKDRKGFPDIDIDIEHERREEVLEDLKIKYGRNSVAGIVTFSKYRLRAAVWDVLKAIYGRVEAGSEADKFKRIAGQEIRYEKREGSDEIVEYMDEEAIIERTKDFFPEETAKKILETADKIVDLHKNLGRHAAGVVITPGDVEDFCPVMYVTSEGKKIKVTQFDMDGIDIIKLIKMDILGLKNLTFVKEVYETAKSFDKNAESPEDIYDYLNGLKNLPEDRVKRMWATICNKPEELFQIMATGKAKRIIRNVQPKNINELCDIIALNRPGPLSKNLDEHYSKMTIPEDLDVPEIKEITKDTRHVLIYQEQIMKTAQAVAGYSLSEADDLRRAVGKKKAEEMENQREKFISGAMEKGYSRERAEAIFSVIDKFAGYAFNKSHSMAYSYLSCVTAWQKANYPAIWAKAFLNMRRNKDKRESLGTYIDMASEFCHIYGPQLIKTDKTLRDAFEMRVIRQAGIPLKEKDAFLLKDSWYTFFGLRDIYDVRNKIEKFADFPVPNNPKELWESAVKYGMTKSVFASLFSLGVFDKALQGYGNDAALIRAVMMIDDEISADFKKAVKAIMPRARKTPEEKLAGHFPFLSLFLLAIETKRYDEIIDEIALKYAEKANEERFYKDPEFRIKCLSVIYETEKQLLGDGLTVKWWDIAAESVLYRFSCFADSAYRIVYSKNEAARSVAREMWVIGKASRRKNDNAVFLSGRNGPAGRPVFFFINEDSEDGIWCVKLKHDGKYFQYVTHIEIEPGKIYETDSKFRHINEKMPLKLKEYIVSNSPDLKNIKFA